VSGQKSSALRVVQWTTGNVGQRSVRAIVSSPELELVGCYAWGAEKVGRDVGELCGIDPVGVVATDDVEALLALRPDCVVYNPKWPDVSEMIRILESGINIAATAGFITGHALGEDRQRIQDACERGGSSIFGSGMNPGFANLLGIVAAGLCDRIDAIRMLESVDSTGYDSADTELSVGYGRLPDDPELPALIERGTAVFGDAVHLVARALGVELDDVRCETEVAITTSDLDLGSWSIAAGHVAGVAASWQGWIGDRKLISCDVRWRKGRTLEPDWRVEHGYIVEVEGMPTVRSKLDVFPPADFVAHSFADYMVLGMVMTAMPAVNAIASVCAAPAGIVTYLDMPLPSPSGWVRP
jgi:hypothetical protein